MIRPRVRRNASCPPFIFYCGAIAHTNGRIRVDTIRIVCVNCITDARWSFRDIVRDTRTRRRAWLHNHGADVHGICAFCDSMDGNTLHACDGLWDYVPAGPGHEPVHHTCFRAFLAFLTNTAKRRRLVEAMYLEESDASEIE